MFLKGYMKEMGTVGISLKPEVTSKYIINSGCEITKKSLAFYNVKKSIKNASPLE